MAKPCFSNRGLENSDATEVITGNLRERLNEIVGFGTASAPGSSSKVPVLSGFAPATKISAMAASGFVSAGS
jgi:hypothetical protein